MKARQKKAGSLRIQSLMQIELLIASLLPGVATLLITTIGTRLLLPAFVLPFVLAFLCCAIAIFCGEFALISLMQHLIREQFSDLTMVCQAYVAGDTERRAGISTEDELTAPLAKAINALLDLTSSRTNKYTSGQSLGAETAENSFKGHLKHLIHEVAPIIEGDLRVRASSAPEDIGAIANICNYMIKAFSQHIRSMRFTTGLTIDVTCEVVVQSVEVAQTLTMLAQDFSQTAEKFEKFTTFIQRLGSTLQLFLTYLQEREGAPSEQHNGLLPEELPLHRDEKEDVLSMVLTEDQRKGGDDQQVILLQEALNIIQGYTTTVEPILVKFSNCVQSLQHSNIDLLDIVERVGSLERQAEQWRDSIATFRLPDNNYWEIE